MSVLYISKQSMDRGSESPAPPPNCVTDLRL